MVCRFPQMTANKKFIVKKNRSEKIFLMEKKKKKNGEDLFYRSIYNNINMIVILQKTIDILKLYTYYNN